MRFDNVFLSSHDGIEPKPHVVVQSLGTLHHADLRWRLVETKTDKRCPQRGRDNDDACMRSNGPRCHSCDLRW